jgi:hypothetical protein
MRKSLAYIPVLGALLVASTASAAAVGDGTFRGRTSQGFKTRVIYKDGQVHLIRVPWQAKRCTPRDGYRFTARRFSYENTKKDPIEQSADGRRFHDRDRVVGRTRTIRAVALARIKGHFVGDDRIVGTQRIRVRTHDRFGDHRCVAKMHWSARRVG